ncbi:hypothetical protein LTR53_018947, partial [Teratosphaeriaceae sp. CCFEE 6253]
CPASRGTSSACVRVRWKPRRAPRAASADTCHSAAGSEGAGTKASGSATAHAATLCPGTVSWSSAARQARRPSQTPMPSTCTPSSTARSATGSLERCWRLSAPSGRWMRRARGDA